MIKLTVPGTPTPKGRPRLGRYGTYTPQKTVDYENLIKNEWIKQYGNLMPLEGPLEARVTFIFEVPKSWSKRKKESALEQYTPHTSRPDLDNLVKCLDALNGLAFKDDSQIASLTADKYYGPSAMMILELEKI